MTVERFEFRVNCAFADDDYVNLKEHATGDTLIINTKEGDIESTVAISRYDAQRLCRMITKWLDEPQTETSGTGQAKPMNETKPKWQTGPIPEPTCKCLLVINPKHNPVDPIVIQSKPLVGNKRWLYDLYQYPYQRSVEEVIEVLGTGKWFIQDLILPEASDSSQPNQ